MKLSIHAKEQLKERYQEEWGLDYDRAVKLIESSEFDLESTYQMILIDDIPVVLICDRIEIITIYPHPIDAAQSWYELMDKVKRVKESNKNLRLALNCSNKAADHKERYIVKLEKKNKKLERQVKESWK